MATIEEINDEALDNEKSRFLLLTGQKVPPASEIITKQATVTIYVNLLLQHQTGHCLLIKVGGFSKGFKNFLGQMVSRWCYY